MSWKQLKREIVHQSPYMTMWIDDIELSSGAIIDYSGATLPDGVMVVATNSDGKLLVIDEYKYAMNKTMTLIPAGGKDADEDAIGAAKRELLEETGYTSDEFESVTTNCPYPSKITQTNTVVRARNIYKVKDTTHESTEQISNVRFIAPRQFREMLKNDTIQLASVIASVAVAAPEFIAPRDD